MQEKQLYLREIFREVTSKQSKAIETREENLMIDLYYHTLNNRHIFDKTESKAEFK